MKGEDTIEGVPLDGTNRRQGKARRTMRASATRYNTDSISSRRESAVSTVTCEGGGAQRRLVSARRTEVAEGERVAQLTITARHCADLAPLEPFEYVHGVSYANGGQPTLDGDERAESRGNLPPCRHFWHQQRSEAVPTSACPSALGLKPLAEMSERGATHSHPQ